MTKEEFKSQKALGTIPEDAEYRWCDECQSHTAQMPWATANRADFVCLEHDFLADLFL